jgi:hypothetical protein
MGEIPRQYGRNSPSIWEKFPVNMGEIPRQYGRNILLPPKCVIILFTLRRRKCSSLN